MRSSKTAKDEDKNIFVYKIIHDLRAPTDSLISGLQAIIKELTMEHLKSDSNLIAESHMRFKYTGQRRVIEALSYIESELNKHESASISNKRSRLLSADSD